MKQAVLGLFAALFALAAAEAQPRGDPEELGFSPVGLMVLDARLEARIDKGDFPGAVLLVARRGRIAHLSALGSLSEDGPKMPDDAIFRIYSMTKPITSAAALMLVEEGTLDLAAPVYDYLPSFSRMRVVSDAGEEEEARRPITVLDLLRHTSGLTYELYGEGPARDAMAAKNIEAGALGNLEVAEALARLPLEHHPGETWEYGRSTDLLGALIETVEARPLGEVLKTRIFEPLGMKDTGFGPVGVSDRPRLAQAMSDDMNIGAYPMFDPETLRAFESGGGGLVSTAQDYARFAQMLMNGGELDGARLLSPASVMMMTTNQLGEEIGPGAGGIPKPGVGFGLGFGVRTDEAGAPAIGSVGEYWWGGAAGTYFWADPEEELFVVFMVQAPSQRGGIPTLLHGLVYGAMSDDYD